MTRDIAERLRAAIENPAAEFQPDGTPKMANLVRDALAEIERLRAALKDIQKEAMTLKPPRHTWYYDRAQNALTNSTEPFVRDGLATVPRS